MSESFGSGVSRTLSAIARQFDTVVFQQSKPPLDSEVNLLQQVQTEQVRAAVRNRYPSGFFGLRNLQDYQLSEYHSNQFYLGTGNFPLIANVNGMIIPVVGTAANSISNRIRLPVPPSTGSLAHFVFLEAWRCSIAPNPSTTNKPSASTLYFMGNVNSGIAGITDDLEDTTIGFETTERVQIQYRIRVVPTTSPETYLNPLDEPTITAQGPTGLGGFNFTNMVAEGDSGCWKAGDGNPTNALATIDGYVYAIPLCLVFRRNTTAYQTGNQNGAVNRNLAATLLVDTTLGATTYLPATLTNNISSSFTGVTQITDLLGSALGDASFASGVTPLTPAYLVLQRGSIREIISISNVNLVTGEITIASRGRGDTVATAWLASTELAIYTARPDGNYADEIVSGDIVDLRNSVGEFDYQNLLVNTLQGVLTNTLHTAWKRSPSESDSAGAQIIEVDYALASPGPNLPNTVRIDGPDGIRSVFSGAITEHPISMLLDPANADPITGLAVDFSLGTSWEVFPAASVGVSGFIPDPATSLEWKNGAVIFLNFTGAKGTLTANGTIRVVTPIESFGTQFPNTYEGMESPQHPLTVQFLDHEATFAAWNPPSPILPLNQQNAGPMYPLFPAFHDPFMVLGDIVNSTFAGSYLATSIDLTDLPTTETFEIPLGAIDFDDLTYGVDTDLDPLDVTTPMLDGFRTLGSLITNHGADPSGLSSELYLLAYGDETTLGEPNNSIFRIVGLGTTHGYAASNQFTARLQLISRAIPLPDPASTGTLTFQIRTQHSISLSTLYPSGEIAVMFTNIQSVISGGDFTFSPWSEHWVGSSKDIPVTTPSLLALRAKVLYSENRGLMHTPDRVVSVRTDDSLTLLRQPLSDFDSPFAVAVSYPSGKVDYPVSDYRLSSDNPPSTPHSSTERAGECFIDAASKTWSFKPFQSKLMTLKSLLLQNGTDVIDAPFTGTIDRYSIWRVSSSSGSTTKYGLPVPVEALPKFGRQDIPYYRRIGANPILSGINHLFQDSTVSGDVFRIIGGAPDTIAPGSVTSALFQTSGTYGALSVITGSLLSTQAIVSRFISFENEISPETGKIIQGIELPPFHGIARLYGVYERGDYATNEGLTPGGFNSDRVTPKSGGPTNLLLETAQYHTLHIRKNGGFDYANVEGSHTYVVTDQALDLTRISGFDPTTETLQDYEYVIECVIFGFAPGFIDRHPYVLIRRYDDTATLVSNATLSTPTPITLVPSMIFPWAAPKNTEVEISYLRTPYQGDPYMTSDGSSVQPIDEISTYGNIGGGDARFLQGVMQQYTRDAAQDSTVILQNPRIFRVLSQVNFWTSEGTGRISAELYPHTDPGYALGDLIPLVTTDRQIRSKALTTRKGKSSGSFVLQVVLYSDLISGADLACEFTFNLNGVKSYTPDFSSVIFSTVTTNEEMAEALYASFVDDPWMNMTFYIEQVGTRIYFLPYETGEYTNKIRVTVSPNTLLTPPLPPLVEIRRAISVRVGLRADFSTLSFGLTTLPNYPGPGSSYLRGGEWEPSLSVSPASSLTGGAVSRLPLGVLANESNFVGETFRGSLSGIVPTSNSGSLVPGNRPEYLIMVDGKIRAYEPYDDTVPSGARSYRIERGATVAALQGENMMVPVNYGISSDSCPTKGSVIYGTAFLVQNFEEEAFTSPSTRSYGGELQMIVATTASNPEAPLQGGTIGAIGYGEGYSAADRYRVEGLPCELISRDPDVDLTTLEPAPYIIGEENPTVVTCVCP
jgi:hypothetical protein